MSHWLFFKYEKLTVPRLHKKWWQWSLAGDTLTQATIKLHTPTTLHMFYWKIKRLGFLVPPTQQKTKTKSNNYNMLHDCTNESNHSILYKVLAQTIMTEARKNWLWKKEEKYSEEKSKWLTYINHSNPVKGDEREGVREISFALTFANYSITQLNDHKIRPSKSQPTHHLVTQLTHTTTLWLMFR